MKKIVEKVVVTKENVLWKAYDGTTFGSEEECKKYEATAESVIKKAFMKLVVGNIVPECYIWGDYGYGSEEFMMAIIDIKDANDLMIANKYFELRGADELINAKYIGKRIMVNIGFDYDRFISVKVNPRTMDDVIEQFTKEMDRVFKYGSIYAKGDN